MLTRRIFLGGAASAATAPLWAGLPETAAAASGRLPVDLVSRRRGRAVYAVVSGRDARTGRWFFLAADGRTALHPRAARGVRTPLTMDAAIRLPSAGVKRLQLPPMDAGRVYFSLDRRLRFFINPDGGLATPSVQDSNDPNADTDWSFFELTYNRHGIYANVSFVDFVGLPMGLRLQTRTGTQSVGGLEPNAVSRIAAGLRRQSARDGSAWRKLVVSQDGEIFRILSPNLLAGAGSGNGPLDSYLDPYIDRVWEKYRSVPLAIDTQARWGTVVGRVDRNGRLVFPRVGSFAKPTTHAVFNCSVAPFVTANNVMGNLSARLAAALNRTTLLANSRQPDATSSRFYRTTRTNHYARLVHAHTAGGAGYAFPYDDVHTAGFNTEGRVVSPHPRLLRVEVG